MRGVRLSSLLSPVHSICGAVRDQLCLKPLFCRVVSVKQTITNTDTGTLFNILLRAGLMLVAHVHDCSSFTSIGFQTEEAIEVLLDLSCDPSHRPLLTRTVLATVSFPLHAADRAWNTLLLILAFTLR